ncbi:unnamed protein product [Owenia fusiformis]|uniref:Cytochrome b-245 light chain n=1 Tax=Owenia fusiformis TaxID=6347 RepID=A0A8J1UVH8_OWEFU|nr:unnamed protein product [Owenia fusiformis]
MGQIEWAMWANEQAIASSFIVFVGGITAIAGQFSNWGFGVYAVLAGLLILLLEYPRGKRVKGNTMERKYQIYLTKLVDKLGPVSSNYFVRFVIHLLLCVPCCFILPTVLGGMCLIITSAIYFVAALKGEQWKPVGLKSNKEVAVPTVATSQPPSQPPPRAPPGAEPTTVSGRPPLPATPSNQI